MKQFDANGVDVDAYPQHAYRGGVYEGGVFGRNPKPRRWFENLIIDSIPPVSEAWRTAHSYEDGKTGDTL